MISDEFLSLCLTVTGYVACVLISVRLYRWWHTGNWDPLPMFLAAGMLVLILVNGYRKNVE